MRIITLQGESKTGKSSTLKRVYFKLLLRGGIDCPALGRRRQSLEGFLNELNGVARCVRNIAVVVQYNGMRVGIFSSGDLSTIVDRGINFFTQNHCDIGINASHDNPCHNVVLDQYSASNQIYKLKHIPSNLNLDVYCETQALRIIELIR